MERNILIIGGGPAGIQASLYTHRAGIDTMVIVHGKSALEKAEKIENYYGFPGGISGSDLLEAGRRQATELGVKIKDEEVIGFAFEDKLTVKTTNGAYPADAVIIAMGQQRNAPPIQGRKEFEGKGISYCAVCDGFFYRGKTVAVLGAGEYAKSEAEELKPLAKEVIMLEDTDSIERFEGGSVLEKVVFKDGTERQIDGLFVAMGTAGSADLAKKIGIITEGNKIVVDENMATNVPGVYAAGDCTGGFLQVSKAVCDGALAAQSVIKYLRGL